MTKLRFFRAVLCQSQALRVLAVTIAVIAGCGGAVDNGASSGPSASPPSCPSNGDIRSGAAVGESCASDGLYCPDTTCDPCNANCRAVACTRGSWSRAVNTAICTGDKDGTPDADVPDSSVCVEIVPSSFDQACTKDSDCVPISAGTFCAGQPWCMCGFAAINVADQGRYQSELQDLQAHLKPGGPGCSCPYLGSPRCVANQCTVCGGAAGACPDGG